ncbi:MAG TPA: hypothetical protein VNW51_01175 [Mucilaginibacter sp.]|jgi:hypothetical protein|nr:hypothetical protein [Mucilaginibacter sp.]
MITSEKINIYRKYGGLVDFWARLGSKNGKDIMTDDDWGIIDSLLQDILLSNNKLTSAEFNSVLDQKLKNLCDGPKVINQLKELAFAK